jgi:hypothetical protein
MRRREFIVALGGAVWPLTARAQQPTFQVGFLYPGPQAAALPRIAAYSSGLQAGGIRPEQVNIVARVTGGDAALLAPMAADLVARKVDLIEAVSPAAVRAAQAATAAIVSAPSRIPGRGGTHSFACVSRTAGACAAIPLCRDGGACALASADPR